jgi:hypothetical protein
MLRGIEEINEAGRGEEERREGRGEAYLTYTYLPTVCPMR